MFCRQGAAQCRDAGKSLRMIPGNAERHRAPSAAANQKHALCMHVESLFGGLNAVEHTRFGLLDAGRRLLPIERLAPL